MGSFLYDSLMYLRMIGPPGSLSKRFKYRTKDSEKTVAKAPKDGGSIMVVVAVAVVVVVTTVI